MKKIFSIFVLVIMAGNVFPQQFKKRFDIVLPDSIQSARGNWIDIDNDGLLDVLFFSTAQSGRTHFQFIKGDTVAAPVLHPDKKEIIAVQSFVLTDYNRDNKMDVLLSGESNGNPLTVIYINKGNFQFEEKQISTDNHSLMKFADLDNDGRPEWLVSGEDNGKYYVKILKRESELSWKVVNDTLKIKATTLEVLDANGDGNFDMFISGKVNPDSIVSTFLINKNDLYFKSFLTAERLGITASGDINLDGTFDLLLMGEDNNTGLVTNIYESSAGTYAVKNDPVVLKDPKAFMADLNSDSLADINYQGKLISNDTVNIVQYGANDYDTLNHKGLIQQAFGDAEHDGDLDLIQLVKANAIHAVFYENQPARKNLAPGTPGNAVAVNVFSRAFMYWDKPADDHTPAQSITYDLYLNGNPDYQVGDFDLMNEKRLVPSHGNNGTQNFRLLKNMSATNLGFAIGSVDNALHAGIPCLGGSGLGGSDSVCVDVDVDTNELTACTGEEVTLDAPDGSLWFSFSEGFLGISNEFSFQADKIDTIFYFSPSKGDCAALKAWTLQIKNDTLKIEFSEKYACQDAEVQLTAESGWDDVSWSSQLKGNLGSTHTITYKVLQPDSVTLTMSNDSSCTIIRKTAIKISKPVLQLNGDNFKILKGSEVQLMASGADTYLWTPLTGLSQADIPNPIASPLSSIQYVVTGYDSLGCTDKASVNIIVEGAGFIPNLFTPNDDGTNDELKIYGITSVEDFIFTIHNREGSVVFKTSDVNEAVQRGWDGTKGGTKQPAGVYFWKIKGEIPSGDKVLLNGKDSGSIVLVR